MFERLVRDDLEELKYSQVIVDIIVRLAIMLFVHWMTSGINAGVPSSFDYLYDETQL